MVGIPPVKLEDHKFELWNQPLTNR
ncbi:hypothetical protein A2U01_0109447, partial [Trifolium medium]|nr:hypothetical protein [Trifolium medium]